MPYFSRFAVTTAFAAIAASAAVSVSAAEPEPRNYVGGLWSQTSVDGLSDSPEPTLLSGLVGHEFNRYVAIEGRIGFGLSSDSFSGVDVKVKNFYGAYARVQAPLADNFRLYALGGYARAEVEVSAGGFSASDSTDDVSWALGGEYLFGANSRHAIAAEWGQAVEDLDALSIVYRYRF